MVVLYRFASLAAALALGSPAALADACRSETYEGAAYTVCEFDLAESDLRLFWQGPDGAPYRTFGALAVALEQAGKRLVFATNGGMYGRDFRPIGLYVEGGRELAAANTAEPPPDIRPVPNFYKKPNGIFHIGPEGAAVTATDRFLARQPATDFATQSGPMLVVDGEIHPVFIPGSSDLNWRNGICAPTPERVTVAITEARVNFHDFGVFFRDRLGCRDALFLDGGSAPGIYAPELGRDDPPGHGGYGPIIAVVAER